jgi:hypothetical protein
MKRDAKADLEMCAITNAQFAREVLLYWIKRAQEAEEMLKEILPAAKYLSQRYDTEDNKLSIWVVMVTKITEFLGTEWTAGREFDAKFFGKEPEPKLKSETESEVPDPICFNGAGPHCRDCEVESICSKAGWGK